MATKSIESIGSIKPIGLINYPYIYEVDFLLDRVYNTLTLDKNKIKLEKPNLVNKDKKSYIPNFIEMAKSVNRTPEELRIFFQQELRMDTSFKEDRCLKIDKIIKIQMVETIYKSFVVDHVMCKTCKSIKTHIEKEKRIKYLICETCGCKKYVV